MRQVAIVFGPENGAVSEKLVYEAAREAHMKSFEQLLVIGFAIEPNARALVEKIESQVGIPATYVQATPDLVMGDLLKTMRSSQLFSVVRASGCRGSEGPAGGEGRRRSATRSSCSGLDTFDPTTFVARPSQRRRRARLVPRHRLERPLLPCLAGVLPAHERMGQPQEGAQTASSTSPCGTTSRAPMSAPVHRRRRTRHRSEGDRRPRQRAARSQVVG